MIEGWEQERRKWISFMNERCHSAWVTALKNFTAKSLPLNGSLEWVGQNKGSELEKDNGNNRNIAFRANWDWFIAFRECNAFRPITRAGPKHLFV
jgi:hypothetical protein